MNHFKLIHLETGKELFLREDHVKSIIYGVNKHNRKVYDMLTTFMDGIKNETGLKGECRL